MIKAINNDNDAEGPETFITTYGVMINTPKGIVRTEAVIHNSFYAISKIA